MSSGRQRPTIMPSRRPKRSTSACERDAIGRDGREGAGPPGSRATRWCPTPATRCAPKLVKMVVRADRAVAPRRCCRPRCISEALTAVFGEPPCGRLAGRCRLRPSSTRCRCRRSRCRS
jgi:hypothetical protein